MKKLGLFLLLSLFLVTGFVSSQSADGPIQGISNLFKSVYDGLIDPFAKFLLGDTVGGKPELFFSKVLIFLLLAFLVHYAANQFEPTRGNRATIISVIVSALAVRALTAEWVEAVILPYTTFGIAVTVIIPLALFFFFVEKGLVGQPALRKISWVFAAVIFVALYFSRYDTPLVGRNDSFFFSPGHIYLYGALASLILLFLDKTIQKSFIKSKYSNLNEINNIKVLSKLRREYNESLENMNSGAITPDQAKTIIGDIRKKARANGISVDIFELPGS